MGSLQTLRYDPAAIHDPVVPLRFGFIPCRREPLSWIEELDKAAAAIAESTSKPLWVCSSGGVDSEVVCETFRKLGIAFNVLTLRFSRGENAHDIAYAMRWCEANGIKQEICTIDIEEFAKREIDAYIRQGYVGGKIFRYLQIKLLSIVEAKGGFGILCGGEQVYRIDRRLPDPTIHDVYLRMDVGFAAPFEWCKKNAAVHEPYFYFSSPELVLAWLRDPFVHFAITNPVLFRHPNNIHRLKASVIGYHFPNQEARTKYNGYENVQELHLAEKKRLQRTLFPLIRQQHLRVTGLIDQLTGSPESHAEPAGTWRLVKNLLG